MAIKVEHRPDRLLQENIEKGCPPGLEKTFVGKVMFPIHKALVEFLNTRVINRRFENKEELQKILDSWPEIAKGKGLYVTKEFAALQITPRNTIACPDKGLGGPLEIGIVRSL